MSDSTKPSNQFSERADADAPGLFGEFFAFLAENRKWWLLPIVITLVLLGGFLLLSATPAGPFIYTLF